MSTSLAAALGGAAGGVALVGIAAILIWYCLFRRRNSSRTSESNSSEPSLQVEGGSELALRGGVSYPLELQGARCLTLQELNAATKNFSSINLIGFGMFGEVYKGLLQDGMIVAIKRRSSIPSQQFIQEVHHLSSIRHRNLVSLLGYCQENDLQMLVYEYIPNGSVSAHLYGASQVSSGKLEFKHRLSIAHGTAKGDHLQKHRPSMVILKFQIGVSPFAARFASLLQQKAPNILLKSLSHLHSLNPPMVHMNFKTANVLVDEDFIPKVADAGLRSLLDRVDGAGPSSRTATDDPFLDPEAKDSGIFSKESDVYSFGVFLLELVSGREVRLDRSIIEWAQNYQESSTFSAFVDQRMGSSFTSEGMREFLRLITWCVNPLSERRPPMNYVEMEIDRIREKEMSLTTIMGEGTTTVTLGSQLFTTSK
ncbi:probable serine/threonine-protein kinase PBL21 isoform X1 [Ananas comosus]|uniref:non-specific serine/threonine protein kinase n=1 Tax=Ananas comosus TaxID=4615 RepID=A0A6P5FP42_ANACO|nr:probable serine/threonine-protein kinase PBL21 isoform X1 [Ananas comosus]